MDSMAPMDSMAAMDDAMAMDAPKDMMSDMAKEAPEAPTMEGMQPITMTMSGDMQQGSSTFEMAQQTMSGKMDGMIKADGMMDAKSDKMNSKAMHEDMLGDMMEVIDKQEKQAEEIALKEQKEASIDEIVTDSRNDLVEDVLRREQEEKTERNTAETTEQTEVAATPPQQKPPVTDETTSTTEQPPINETDSTSTNDESSTTGNDDETAPSTTDDENSTTGNDDETDSSVTGTNSKNDANLNVTNGTEYINYTNSELRTESVVAERLDFTITDSENIKADNIAAASGVNLTVSNTNGISFRNTEENAQDTIEIEGNTVGTFEGNGGNDQYFINEFSGNVELNTKGGDSVTIESTLLADASVILNNQSIDGTTTTIRELDGVNHSEPLLSLESGDLVLSFGAEDDAPEIVIKDIANANYAFAGEGTYSIDLEVGELINVLEVDRNLAQAEYAQADRLTKVEGAIFDTDGDARDILNQEHGSVLDDSITLSGKYQLLRTYDGNDDVTITEAGTGIGEGSVIELGDGHDKITLNGAINEILIDGGNGVDVIKLDSHFDNSDLQINLSPTNSNAGSIVVSQGVHVSSIRDVEAIISAGGSDSIMGSENDEYFNGNGGEDLINGSGGNDVLFGGNGGDTLDGGNGNDTLNGGDGNDILMGSNGSDVIIGGNGDDEIILSNQNFSAHLVDGGSGNDKVKLIEGTYDLTNANFEGIEEIDLGFTSKIVNISNIDSNATYRINGLSDDSIQISGWVEGDSADGYTTYTSSDGDGVLTIANAIAVTT